MDLLLVSMADLELQAEDNRADLRRLHSTMHSKRLKDRGIMILRCLLNHGKMMSWRTKSTITDRRTIIPGGTALQEVLLALQLSRV
jgi:hypothetical protein